MIEGHPRVTVVVPVHGGGAHAVEAINSLLAQTYEPIDILVIDDGSPLAADQELAGVFGPRIRYVHQGNRGLCATLNRALFELVDTPLFARLDQDDLAAPDRIAAQVELLESEAADACLTRIWRMGPSGRRLSIHPDGSGPHFDYDPPRHGQIVHSSLLARTEFLRGLGGYDPTLYPADDYDLSLRMHAAGRVVVHGTPLVDYRIHDASMTFVHFREMGTKSRYIEERARSGEGDFPPYVSWLATARFSWRDHLRLRSHCWYRRAGIEIDTGRRLRGAVLLLGALVVDPVRTGRRLRTIVRP